jgi:preprotein translocase subunit YajC
MVSHTEQPSAPSGADGHPAGGGGGFAMLFPILLLLPLFFLLFWSSRSQQKKQAAALAALKKGDRVVLQSGLIGRIVEMGDRIAKVEIAPGVKVEVAKSGLGGKDTGDGTTAAAKK